ncbi:MAG: PLP-dependent aminotransferase family protein [Candidatus Delongbacteria bacterium]|nr:PLP-dependent aminotransferase family protein [Candidatus Delongbacteria bacterium]
MIKNWSKRFSENAVDYEGYPIGKTLKLLASNPNIISLAGGLPSPDVFQKAEVRLATKKSLDGSRIDQVMQYSSIPGEKALFDAVIKYLKRDKINIKEENLLVTTSGQHGLDLAGRLFLNPGDSVMLDRPTFAGAIVAFDLNRPKYIGVDIEEDGSNVKGFRKKLEAIKKKGGKMPKFIYVVPDFQNPTGISMSVKKREALLDLSYEYDIPVIEDSPYKDLRYQGKIPPSIFSIDQKKYKGTNVIGLYTFSKIFCPGMRVGFNIGPAEVIKKMCNIKEGNILNTPKYNQDICAAYLTEMDLEKHFENCRNYYRDKLKLFLATMDKYFPKSSGVSWTKPEGGLFLWVTVPEHIDTEKLFYQAVEKYNVAFVPGWQFYGGKPANNHMRLNFSYSSKEQLVEAIKRLAKCIKDQK